LESKRRKTVKTAPQSGQSRDAQYQLSLPVQISVELAPGFQATSRLRRGASSINSAGNRVMLVRKAAIIPTPRQTQLGDARYIPWAGMRKTRPPLPTPQRSGTPTLRPVWHSALARSG